MLISVARADDSNVTITATPPVAEVPSATEAVMMNLLLILIMVALFYFLLIVPQQKRFKKHREMLDGLKRGDSVVTAGGLIGKLDKIEKDSDEVVIDLGGTKVTALRSTIQARKDSEKARQGTV